MPACPRSVLEIVPDDDDEPKAAVKRLFARTLAEVCLGFHARCAQQEVNCHRACRAGAITHSW